MKKTYAYLRTAIHFAKASGTGIIYQTNGVAFLLATIAKDHIRLIALAVKADAQGNGVGSSAVQRLKSIALGMDKHRITFRTPTNERGKDFWLKQRARIIGINGNDYEMEIVF